MVVKLYKGRTPYYLGKQKDGAYEGELERVAIQCPPAVPVSGLSTRHCQAPTSLHNGAESFMSCFFSTCSLNTINFRSEQWSLTVIVRRRGNTLSHGSILHWGLKAQVGGSGFFLTEQVPLKKERRFRQTGNRISMLLKLRHLADARAQASADCKYRRFFCSDQSRAALCIYLVHFYPVLLSRSSE